MSQNYIFCGPDRSGKTTIAKGLASWRDFNYFKNSSEHRLFGEGGHSFKTQLEYCGPLMIDILKQLELGKSGLILDRFTPCEFAYAQAFNRPTNQEMIWWMDDQLADLGFKIIFCYKEVYKTWDDDLIKLKNVKQIVQGYRDYFKRTKMPVLSMETSEADLNAQLDQIFPFLFV